jgi:hypothetical protein
MTIHHPDNISMEEDFILQFVTQSRNRISLLKSYPNNGNKGVYAAKPLFFMVFDKTINSSTIRDEVNVLDANGTALSKITRSVRINKVGVPYGDFYFELTDPLIAGNNYTLRLGGNVMDDTGIKLVEPIDINFTASAVEVTDKTVVDDFEVAGKFAYDEAQSENDSLSSMIRSTTQKLFGSSAYRIKSIFTDTSASAVYSINDPLVTTETNKVFGLHVYGDLSGNELQLQFRSVTNEADIRYLKLCDLNFMGWEFVQAQFAEEAVYKLTGLRVVRKNGILSKSVDIHVDNLLQYETPISGLTPNRFDQSVRVYPNPAAKIFFVKSEENSLPLLELYSLNGVLLKAVNDNQLTVTEFEAGTYLLKVKMQSGVVSKVVMISK